MNHREAEQAADDIRRDGGHRKTRVAVCYQYTRGCYAVLVTREGETLALLDEMAVSIYRENHPAKTEV